MSSATISDGIVNSSGDDEQTVLCAVSALSISKSATDETRRRSASVKIWENRCTESFTKIVCGFDERFLECASALFMAELHNCFWKEAGIWATAQVAAKQHLITTHPQVQLSRDEQDSCAVTTLSALQCKENDAQYVRDIVMHCEYEMCEQLRNGCADFDPRDPIFNKVVSEFVKPACAKIKAEVRRWSEQQSQKDEQGEQDEKQMMS